MGGHYQDRLGYRFHSIESSNKRGVVGMDRIEWNRTSGFEALAEHRPSNWVAQPGRHLCSIVYWFQHLARAEECKVEAKRANDSCKERNEEAGIK